MKKKQKRVTGFKLIYGYLGVFLLFIGALSFVPLIMMAFYPSETDCWREFVYPGIGSMGIGGLLYFLFLFKRKPERFQRYEDIHLLFLIWISAIIVGAFPFYIGTVRGKLDMSFSESFFESTSAYSTTGLSCFTQFTDVSGAYCPHIFCFHRSLMQFVGGCGLVLILAGVLSNQGSFSLYKSEGHNDKLMPSLGKSAKLIFLIYSGYTLLGAFAFWLAGMDFFDALNHSMCALSTAGFSTKSSSFLYYSQPGAIGNGILPVNSIAIEIIAMFLMLFGGISFVLHTYLLSGQWKKFCKDDEVKFGTCLIIGLSVLAFLSVAISTAAGFTTNASVSAREGIFNIISSLTTTGFTNVSIDRFVGMGQPIFFLSILCMILGGGMGSTSGGIKLYRIYIIWKDFTHDLRYRFAPARQINPKSTYRYGRKQQITPQMSKEAHNYATLYIIVLVIGTVCCSFLPGIRGTAGEVIQTDLGGRSTMGLTLASYEFASALSGTGLSALDFIAYKHAQAAAYPWLLWILSIGMLLGRLEIMPIVYSARNIIEEIQFTHHEIKKHREERKNMEEGGM